MALLEARSICKHFGGILALDNVSMEVEPAESVGLVGPNGAGKTTLFNCLLGVLKPDSGQVLFDGHDLSRMPTYKRARLGIGRTFQRIELFTEMTPREHFLVAERARNGSGSLLKDLLNRGRPTDAEQERAQQVIELLGLEREADLPVESLSLGRGRLVELGRALVGDPKLLLLDEPSSGLDRSESQTLAGVLERIRQEKDTAVLLVEHDLELVQQVVSRLFVLDFGQMIASGPTREVLAHPAVRKAYLGQEAERPA
jgi:branched-chain amino acid transport system ATP-binding protein